MKFHEKLVMLRKQRGWSQAELREHVGVHIAHLSRMENGKAQPSVEMLQKLARAFGVTMDYLMDEQLEEPATASVKDKALAERIDQLESLDELDRQTILHVIDTMLTKRRMLDLLLKQKAS
jgi:transcriptional regulator with XRE-family HTH domain